MDRDTRGSTRPTRGSPPLRVRALVRFCCCACSLLLSLFLVQLDSVILPPPSLERTLVAANLTDYLHLLQLSGMLDQVSRMQGVTLFAPIQGTIHQLANFTTREQQQREQKEMEQAASGQGQVQPAQTPPQPVPAQPQLQQPQAQGQQQQPSAAPGQTRFVVPQQQQQQPAGVVSGQPQQQPPPQPIQQQPTASSGHESTPVAPGSQLRIPEALLQQLVKMSIANGVFYSPAFNFTHQIQTLQGETLYLGNTTQQPIAFGQAGTAEGQPQQPMWTLGTTPTQLQGANATANATAPTPAAAASYDADAMERELQVAPNATSPANATAAGNATAPANATSPLGEWNSSSIVYQDLLFDGGVIHVRRSTTPHTSHHITHSRTCLLSHNVSPTLGC